MQKIEIKITDPSSGGLKERKKMFKGFQYCRVEKSDNTQIPSCGAGFHHGAGTS